MKINFDAEQEARIREWMQDIAKAHREDSGASQSEYSYKFEIEVSVPFSYATASCGSSALDIGIIDVVEMFSKV